MLSGEGHILLKIMAAVNNDTAAVATSADDDGDEHVATSAPAPAPGGGEADSGTGAAPQSPAAAVPAATSDGAAGGMSPGSESTALVEFMQRGEAVMRAAAGDTAGYSTVIQALRQVCELVRLNTVPSGCAEYFMTVVLPGCIPTMLSRRLPTSSPPPPPAAAAASGGDGPEDGEPHEQPQPPADDNTSGLPAAMQSLMVQVIGLVAQYLSPVYGLRPALATAAQGGASAQADTGSSGTLEATEQPFRIASPVLDLLIQILDCKLYFWQHYGLPAGVPPAVPEATPEWRASLKLGDYIDAAVTVCVCVCVC